MGVLLEQGYDYYSKKGILYGVFCNLKGVAREASSFLKAPLLVASERVMPAIL